MDMADVDMTIGSLAGPLCAGGGFCAASEDVVEHQRISASAYTFSAALPAMLATTASEALTILQTGPEVLTQLRDNIKALRAQLDPRSDWVQCASAPENPIVLLVLKPEVVASKGIDVDEQERLLQDVVDEVRGEAPNASWRMLTVSTEPSQWGAHHAIETPDGAAGDSDGRRLAGQTGAEGVRHGGPLAEGD